MEWTPIKIPGKLKVDKSKAAIAARKSLNRKRGRPLQLETSKPATTAKSSRNRPKKASKLASKMSIIEQLPPEILARIFWYSMNFDMPRCSQLIGQKLSSLAIYKQTVIEAFGPIWDLWYGYSDRYPPKNNEVDVSEKADLVTYDRPGDHILERNVLRCCWATVDLLVAAKELWIQKNALKRPFKPLKFLPLSKEKQELEEQSRKTVIQYFAEDYAQFCEAVENLNEESLITCNWDRYTDIHYRTEVPSNLLVGPWTEEMVRHLFWLVRGGACIQWLDSTISEAAKEGFYTAIRTGNLRVLHLLDWMNAVKLPDRHSEVIWAIHNSDGDKVAIVKRVLYHGKLEDRMDGRILGRLYRSLESLRILSKDHADWETNALIVAVMAFPMFRRWNR